MIVPPTSTENYGSSSRSGDHEESGEPALRCEPVRLILPHRGQPSHLSTFLRRYHPVKGQAKISEKRASTKVVRKYYRY